MLVGGGQGRTPFIGKTIRPFLPKEHLLSYLEAILRVYNMLGRRDNLFKARIKILVHEVGAERFTEMVEEEWEQLTRRSGRAAAGRTGAHPGLLRAAAVRDAAGDLWRLSAASA